jgi:hypothetical protein
VTTQPATEGKRPRAVKNVGFAPIAAIVLVLAGCARPTAPHPAVEPSEAASQAAGPSAGVSLGSPTPTDSPSVARANAVTAIAEKLLDRVQVPPGSTGLARPSAGPLASPASWPGSDDLIDVSRLWKSAGTVDSVLTYIQTHIPTGLTMSGSGSGGSDATASLSYAGPSGGLLDQGAEILITAAPDDAGGVGVRVDVQDVWRPVRTADEQVPATVTKATIVRKTGQSMASSAPTTTTLDVGSAVAQRIARLLNALPTEAGYVSHGPSPSTVTSVTFTSGGAELTFTTNDARAEVSVTASGTSQPLLMDATDVLTYLDRLFGIADAAAPVDSTSPASPSIVHFACPPPGWSPLTATATELQEYGFPPRPTGAPGVDKGWVDAMSHVTFRTCPVSASSPPSK